MFTEKEIAYIHSQHLARLATVSKSGQTDVAPVGFRFDGEKFFITGFDITRTFKYKNVKAGNTLVALVIDDLASVQPWVARGVKVHGTAQIVEGGGRAALVIHPNACGAGAWTMSLSRTASLTAAKPAWRRDMSDEVTKTYTNGAVTVVWKAGLCQHSAICFRGLPRVFDPRKRPWVNPEGASTEEIVVQVQKCPSGALSTIMNTEAS